MIIKTQALVLQIRPWSRTSHMVTWLTQEHGKVVTAVKGACRPKSAFLGQYDLFYTCDLLFYRRENDGVHAIRECTPIVLREPLRQRWRQAAAAAYLADLTARVSVPHHDSNPLFLLLTDTLDRLTGTPLPSALELLIGYETRLLKHLGLMPDLTTCPLCHTPDRPWLRFSLPSGRFVCPHLEKSQAGDVSLTLHRKVRDLFRDLCAAESEAGAIQVFGSFASKKNEAELNLLLGLSRFLGMFIAFHLDVPSAVRRVTLEMLNTTPPQKSALLENNQP